MNEIKEYKDKLPKISERFISLTNKETFEKECSFALQHFNKNSYLAGATTESKLEAVLNIAQIGLTLNPVLKLAYLVPRKAKVNGQYVVQCHLEPSYQGLVKLITDTGSATTVYAHCVYEGDEFDVELGTSTKIVHKPKFKSKKIETVYAVAVLPDGSRQVDIMPISDVHEIRDSSESYKAWVKNNNIPCIWVKFEGEMAKKTVTKRLVKYLPKTDRWEKLGNAVNLDNEDYKCSVGQVSYIESLLMAANIDDNEKAMIDCDLYEMSHSDAAKMISYLKENQLDPLTMGNSSPSMTEIKDGLADRILRDKD